MHYPLGVMLTCVRWYVAYPLSLRHLEEIMAERGICVDHSTVQRWAIKIVPVLAAVFRRRRRPVGKRRVVQSGCYAAWRTGSAVARSCGCQRSKS